VERELWQPFGAAFDASWGLDTADIGSEKMECGINARTIDFARRGVLYLQAGCWRGERLIDSA
jgi:hypothetical protein